MAFFFRSFSLWLALAIPCALFSASYSHAQQDTPSKRRLVEHSTPACPSLARSMALQGIVRVEAVVSADGSVKPLDIKGGHPVLAQAAANAVRKWRWEPAAHESHESVEVKFSAE
jgi:TonB family protein